MFYISTSRIPMLQIVLFFPLLVFFLVFFFVLVTTTILSPSILPYIHTTCGPKHEAIRPITLDIDNLSTSAIDMIFKVREPLPQYRSALNEK